MVRIMGEAIVVPARRDARDLARLAGMLWDPRLRSWVAPLTPRFARRVWQVFGADRVEPVAHPRFLRLLQAYDEQERLLADLRLAREDDQVLHALAAGLEWVTEPYRHQIHTVLYGLFFPRWAYFLGLGTGKTKAAIDTFRLLQGWGEVDHLLVVCPATLRDTWQQQVEQHSHMSCEVLQGTRAVRAARLHETSADVVVTNYEALDGCGAAYGEVVNERWMLVFDESHRAKSPKAARTKLAIGLSAGAGRVLLLTGTPYTRHLRDIFTQLLVLDRGETFGASWSRFFQAAIGRAGVSWNGEVDWSKNSDFVDMVKAQVGRISTVWATAECVDLPDRVFTTIAVQLGAEQRKVYKAVKASVDAAIGGRTVRAEPEVLVQLLRLAQVTSGFVRQDGQTTRILPNAKLGALRDLVVDLAVQSIVWCRFHEEINMVSELLDELGITHAECSGRLSAKGKRTHLERFRTGAARVLVAIPGAGGVGLTLNEAKAMIYYSVGYNFAEYDQSLGRNYRIGQHTNVAVYLLVGKKTIDQRIMDNLKGKRSLGHLLVGGYE